MGWFDGLFGGGGSKTTIKQNILNDVSLAMTASLTNNCSSSVTGNQIISFCDVKNSTIANLSQKQDLNLDASCKQTQKVFNYMKSELETKFATMLKKNTNWFNKALQSLVGGDKTNIQRTIRNILDQSLDISMVSNCLARMTANQKIQGCRIQDSSLYNFSQAQIFTLVSECISGNQSVNNMLENIFDQNVISKTEVVKGPLDGLLNDLFGGLKMWMLGFIFLVIIIVVAWKFMSEGKSGSKN